MDAISISILLFLKIVIFLWIRWRKKNFEIFSNHGIPGPKPSFYTGNLNDIIKKREKFATEYHEKYGNIFGYFYGAHPILSVTDPELLKLIQVKEYKNFLNKKFPVANGGVPTAIILKSLVFKEDEEWKKTRGILSPFFSSAKIRNMSQTINNCIDEFLVNINQKSVNEEEFDIFLILKNLTLDLTSRTAFGIHNDVQKGKNIVFAKSIGRVLGTDYSSAALFLSECFPEIEPIPSKLMQIIDVTRNIFGYPAVKLVVDICKDIIKQRNKLDQKRNDLLQSMIDGKDGTKKSQSKNDFIPSGINAEKKHIGNGTRVIPFSAEEIMGNAVLFMASGYDTTSGTLGFTCRMLSVHQDVQDAARNEIKNVIGEKGHLEYDDIAKLQYLDQVISEVLRLYPVTCITITRTVKEEFKYKSLVIPKGVSLTVPVSTLHKDPKYWIEPNKFKPERFSPENKSNINTTIYQPFGNGPRNCIGMRLAQAFMKLTLSRLLLSYRLECCTDEAFKYGYTVFLLHPEKVIVKAIPLIS